MAMLTIIVVSDANRRNCRADVRSASRSVRDQRDEILLRGQIRTPRAGCARVVREAVVHRAIILHTLRTPTNCGT